MSTGIVYIASGEQFVQEAITSAHSVAETMPETPITIYADRDPDADVFDNVILRDDFNYDQVDSIILPEMCPYEKNLFLDTDTYLYEGIGDVFDILDQYELAACHSPGRVSIDGVPEGAPEYNTGVVGYRRSDAVQSFFKQWRETFFDGREGVSGRNQQSFTQTVWDTNIDIWTLPPEYNVRVPRAAYLCGPAKVIHGRHPNGLANLATELNQTAEARVYYTDWKLGKSMPAIRDRKTLINRTKQSLQEDGILGTMKTALLKPF